MTNISYDAENRLTQVNKNGALLSRFYYDGDGRRVKSVTGSESILLVGAHFEASTIGSTTTNTNYYFAGTTRVAVRKYIVPQNNMTLTYLLSDHLGSTSLTMDSVTNEVIETRYKAWGEVRYTTPSKTLPTRNTFTGQYSDSYINLLWYTAC